MKNTLMTIIITVSMLGHAWCNDSTAKSTLSTLESAGIENAENPKIRELYEKLKTQTSELEKITTEYHNALTDNTQAMHDKEQSTENKLLGAAGIGSVGIGGMQLASAISEQKSDQDAESNMRAYLATFICDYGNGKTFTYGTQNIELPVGDLTILKSEFMTLAADLKTRKTVLELAPGIESIEIIDSATSGLYDDIQIGKTDGAFTSLSDAIINPDGPDASEWNEQKSETTQKLKSGAITAGVGAVGTAVANLAINKDAPKENSKKIKSDFESKQQKLQSDISATESELNTAIAENKKLIDEFNTLLTQHQDFIKTITESDCFAEFSEYKNYIATLSPITDEFADTSNLKIPYDLTTQKEAYKKCADAAILARKIKECTTKPYHEWVNNKCVDKTPSESNKSNRLPDNKTSGTPDSSTESDTDTGKPIAVAPVPGSESTDTDKTTSDATSPAPDQCPAENPRLRSLTEKNRVGDPCTYGNLTSGRVFKRADGTCSCTALSCIDGYIVENGICKEAPTTKQNTATVANTTNTNLKYFAVCNADRGKSGGTEYCIDKPFNWTNVQMLQATALAAEYALVKNNHNVRCENTYRESGNDYWFSCTSTDNQYFYEFKFDDTIESIDADIQTDIRIALCEKIYDGKLKQTKTTMAGTRTTVDLCQLTDTSKLAALQSSAEKLGIPASKYNSNSIRFASSTAATYTTKKINGIDPFAFYNSDIQIRANGQMIDALFEYSALQLAPREIKTFTCHATPHQISKTIDDHKTRGTSDDVLACFVNGTAVDFVFDDMSELSKKLSQGGYSNMNCTVAGGTYNGYDCLYVGKTQCERIRKLSSATMPSNELPFWNDSTQECQLPAAADATKYQQNINIGIMVGGVIIGAVVTVATGGTGTAALALLAVETIGGAVEIAATQTIYNEIDKFIQESKLCKNASCAQEMLKTNLQRMSNMTFDMTDAQINGIDAELTRLANLIPTDSELYTKIAQNGPTTGDNQVDFIHSWEPEQIWRAVGITLQLTSLLTGIGKWVIGKVNKLPRATTAIADKVSDAHRLKLPPHDPTPAGGGTGARAGTHADDASDAGRATNGNTGSKTTSGADNAGRATNGNTGSKTTSGADNAARMGGTDTMHPDLAKYRTVNAAERKTLKRQMQKKYHSDKIAAEFPELIPQADEIFKHIDQLDNLSNDELIMLSNRMTEFDSQLAAARAAKDAANTAADAAHAADNVGDAAKNTDTAASTSAKTTATADNDTQTAKSSTRTRTTNTAADAAQAIPSNFSTAAKQFINEINEIGKNRDYAISKGIGRYNNQSPLSKSEEEYIRQLLSKRKDLIHSYYSQGNGSGGTIGANWFVTKKTDNMFIDPNNGHIYRHISTKPINNLRGKAITTINGKQVFLEPLDNGGLIGNVSGRPVVVVNYDGHKIPFYASSGNAGKLDVPTGKWEVFFGFGPDGWFNKADIDSIVNHYDSPELKQIANALDDMIGDQRNIEDVFASISRKHYNGHGNVASYDGPTASIDFINNMLDFTPIDYNSGLYLLYKNIDQVKNYFNH